jgi:selenocysteine-specific elongation factor
VALLTGLPPAAEGWLVAGLVRAAAEDALRSSVHRHHAEHPLEEGAGLAAARRTVGDALRAAGGPRDAGAVEAVLAGLESGGELVRTASTVRLTTHRVALEERGEDVERLLAAIGGDREATPPTVQELVASGISRDVIDAADREGVVVRVSADLVITPALAARAEALARGTGNGITVSAFRESLGTTRRYAVPMLEWLDRRGVTRRDGDLRFPRA